MRKDILIKASVLGILAIVLGAFGAHALKSVLPAEKLISYETGVRYQMYQALALIGIYVISQKEDVKQFKIAALLMFYGVVLFSGSIYILSFKDILHIESLKFLGPVTPIGGFIMILGWVYLLIGALKIKKD